jgi:hypothetical protein
MAEKPTAAGRRPAVVIAVCGLALLVSGCAYSLSEFAQEPAPPATSASIAPAVAEPLATGAAVPLQPTALVDEGPASQPRQSTPQVMATGSLPPPASATEPDSALLTPEEKAKVIAELEALARSQKVTAPPVTPQTKCQEETLDAAERLRREVEGIAC